VRAHNSGQNVSSRGLPRKAADGLMMGKDGRDAVRVTTTFTRQQHAELERIAKQNGVKLAWLVRRAAERLIQQANDDSQLPLNLQPGEEDDA
jgi:hypothetical protein